MIIYGPVPSRRLGYSLGIDIIPYKTCSFDCIYCQLGKTTCKTIERKEWLKESDILSLPVERFNNPSINYITFAGSGEPTLNLQLDNIIGKIKQITSTPIVLLTNSSLLYLPEVRHAIKDCDLIIPTITSATEEIFNKIHRPAGEINLKLVLQGIKALRKEFKGKMWLEVMLIKNINEGVEHIKEIKSIINEINPHKVQLNTVMRPPTEHFALQVGQKRLEEIKNFLGHNAEIICVFKNRDSANVQGASVEKQCFLSLQKRKIVEIIKRRPVTIEDISLSLGLHKNEILKYVDILEKEGKVKAEVFEDKVFYKA